MNEKTKTVYYCDFCKKHGLQRHSMRDHEIRCTMNPWRVCNWHEPRKGPSLVALRQRLGPITQDRLDWLHDQVDGCPVCQLAVLKQSNLTYADYPPGVDFNYQEAVEKWRENEREDAERETWADIQRDWL